MQVIGPVGSAAAVRRKLRAPAAVIADSGATEHEKANAEALKARMQRQLRRHPQGFRGRACRLMRLS